MKTTYIARAIVEVKPNGDHASQPQREAHIANANHTIGGDHDTSMNHPIREDQKRRVPLYAIDAPDTLQVIEHVARLLATKQHFEIAPVRDQVLGFPYWKIIVFEPTKEEG